MAATLPLVSHADECHICSVKAVAEAMSFSVTCSPAQPGVTTTRPRTSSEDGTSPGPPTATGVMVPGGDGSLPFLMKLAPGDVLGWAVGNKKQQKQPQKDRPGQWLNQDDSDIVIGWGTFCQALPKSLSPSVLGK